MQSARSQPQDDVAGADRCTGQHPVALDGAYGETSEIVISRRIEARHFRGLAADQSATRIAAAGGNSVHNLASVRHRESTTGIIIEKKQRFRSLHHQVVDAHGDKVDAERSMLTKLDTEPQFGADAVRGGDENGVAVSCCPQVETSPKPTQVIQRTRASGASRQGGDGSDKFLTRVDIDARVLVGEADNGSPQ